MPTRIITCNCNTGSACKYQEELYGKGCRVANEYKDKSNNTKARCTCCGKEA